MIRAIIFLIFLSFSIQAESLNIKFSGESYFYNALGFSKTNNLKVENVKNNMFLNLLIKGLEDWNAFLSFNFNTDLSYYNFLVDRAFLKYRENLIFFYREQVFNFDDGLRILDDEVETFYQPVKFYQSPIERFAYFGRDYMGIYFQYENDLIDQRISLASPYYVSENSIGNQYIFANKTSIFISPIEISANIIYKNQNFPLPEVNKDNWAYFGDSWYEFDTNSFYKSKNEDYQIIATGEGNIGFLEDKIILWIESGIDKKSGGHYARSTMKATSAGNIEARYTWQSPEWNYFILGSGLLLDLNYLKIEPDFKLKQGENTSISYYPLWRYLEIETNKPSFKEIGLKAFLEFKNINVNIEFWQGSTSKDYISYIFIDEYNWGKRFFLTKFNKITGFRNYNKLDFLIFKIIPEIEKRYYETEYYTGRTIELNFGILLDIIEKLELFGNIRYKNYSYEAKYWSESRVEDFVNIFSQIRYKLSKSIYLALDFGMDPRILYDKDYGFEYSLRRYVDTHPGMDAISTVLSAEDYFEKNYFITLRTEFKW